MILPRRLLWHRLRQRRNACLALWACAAIAFTVTTSVGKCSETNGSGVTSDSTELTWPLPRVWTEEETSQALRLLEEKLQRWESHSAEETLDVLKQIGVARIEPGRPYLERFMRVDPQLDRARLLRTCATLALGKLGGSKALETLSTFWTDSPPDALSPIAVALGSLDDRRAIEPLERLAEREEPDIRRRAYSSLARYCPDTSRRVVAPGLSDPDPEVRNAAVWWFATCGTIDDAPILSKGLTDTAPIVRAHALQGLTRLRSRLACADVQALVVDENLTVQIEARKYAEVCRQPQ
jgi:HEAT repeat protein